jgi:hypothetical protein
MMQYILKTGFGKSSESYGGTQTSPNLGLGQGSSASPPGFLALSSLIVNVYRRIGHGAVIKLSYASCLFLLSLAMYVNDTDLLHWQGSSRTNPNELIVYVQKATMEYGYLVQASGGILKEKKCSVFFLDCKFVKGRTRLKSISDLPAPAQYIMDGEQQYPSYISIPQPGGPHAPIVTHDATTASKILGVHFSPARNSDTHVGQMLQRGLDWVDCLHTKPVSWGDVWLSFYFQLYLGISWGLVTMCMPPVKLDNNIQWIHGQALPFWGVNGKIKKEWRTLPEMYQGLAMPYMPLVVLVEKLSFLLCNWSFQGLAHSNVLAMAYDNFLVKLGLYGSLLAWSFAKFGQLSTEAMWFHNLWQLVHTFEVKITI